jgi:hypothetical protein
MMMAVDLLTSGESKELRERWTLLFGTEYFGKFGMWPARLRDAAYWRRPRTIHDTRAEYFLQEKIKNTRFTVIPDNANLLARSIETESLTEFSDVIRTLVLPDHSDYALVPSEWNWTGILSEDGGPWVITMD